MKRLSPWEWESTNSASGEPGAIQYVPGEPVQIEVVLFNHDPINTVVLHFPTSCQVSYKVEDLEGSALYFHPAHQFCLAILTTLIIPPGQTETVAFSWIQVDDAGAQVPLPSYYVIRGIVLNQNPEPSGITGIGIAP